VIVKSYQVRVGTCAARGGVIFRFFRPTPVGLLKFPEISKSRGDHMESPKPCFCFAPGKISLHVHHEMSARLRAPGAARIHKASQKSWQHGQLLLECLGVQEFRPGRGDPIARDDGWQDCEARGGDSRGGAEIWATSCGGREDFPGLSPHPLGEGACNAGWI
jgi:hypothetical protein